MLLVWLKFWCHSLISSHIKYFFSILKKIHLYGVENICFLCNKLKLTANIPSHFSTFARVCFPVAVSKGPSNCRRGQPLFPQMLLPKSSSFASSSWGRLRLNTAWGPKVLIHSTRSLILKEKAQNWEWECLADKAEKGRNSRMCFGGGSPGHSPSIE